MFLTVDGEKFALRGKPIPAEAAPIDILCDLMSQSAYEWGSEFYSARRVNSLDELKNANAFDVWLFGHRNGDLAITPFVPRDHRGLDDHSFKVSGFLSMSARDDDYVMAAWYDALTAYRAGSASLSATLYHLPTDGDAVDTTITHAYGEDDTQYLEDQAAAWLNGWRPEHGAL